MFNSAFKPNIEELNGCMVSRWPPDLAAEEFLCLNQASHCCCYWFLLSRSLTLIYLVVFPWFYLFDVNQSNLWISGDSPGIWNSIPISDLPSLPKISLCKLFRLFEMCGMIFYSFFIFQLHWSLERELWEELRLITQTKPVIFFPLCCILNPCFISFQNLVFGCPSSPILSHPRVKHIF